MRGSTPQKVIGVTLGPGKATIATFSGTSGLPAPGPVQRILPARVAQTALALTIARLGKVRKVSVCEEPNPDSASQRETCSVV